MFLNFYVLLGLPFDLLVQKRAYHILLDCSLSYTSRLQPTIYFCLKGLYYEEIAALLSILKKMEAL